MTSCYLYQQKLINCKNISSAEQTEENVSNSIAAMACLYHETEMPQASVNKIQNNPLYYFGHMPFKLFYNYKFAGLYGTCLQVFDAE